MAALLAAVQQVRSSSRLADGSLDHSADVNPARFTFLDPAAPAFYPDWDAVADQNVATLRAEVGRNPYGKALSDLIGELSTRGYTFRQRWARHEVRPHRAGAKRLNHPVVGELSCRYEAMDLAADEGLSLIVCHVTILI